MTIRPIIFSGPMVRALLDGRKTQTRRVLKPQPKPFGAGGWYRPYPAEPWNWQYCSSRQSLILAYAKVRIVEGDLLWVRESIQRFNGEKPKPTAQYVADVTPIPHRGIVEGWVDGRAYWQWDKARLPSIHMPRWASRLTLKVTAVKVERLQDISEEDAKAEGVDAISMAGIPRQAAWSCRQDFSRLWDSINAKRAPWESNPWVVAITFEVIKASVDSLPRAASA